MHHPRPHLRNNAAWATAWAVLLDLALAAMVGLWLVDRLAPPQDLPWTPLRLSDPIGLATFGKLEMTRRDPTACRRVLSEGGVRFQNLPPRRSGFCAIENAVRIDSGTTPLSPGGLAMTCPLALGYALWDRQVLRPAARESLSARVATVGTFGSYSCRRQYGAATGRVSEHATANALDVAGVTLTNGRRLTIGSDFRGAGAEGAFLRRVRRGACVTFRVVLSPDYNAAHRDHLHLDQGPFRACR